MTSKPPSTHIPPEPVSTQQLAVPHAVVDDERGNTSVVHGCSFCSQLAPTPTAGVDNDLPAPRAPPVHVQVVHSDPPQSLTLAPTPFGQTALTLNPDFNPTRPRCH